MPIPKKSSQSPAARAARAARAAGAPVPSGRVRVTGRLAVRPGLDPGELAYLSAFCESRRWDRAGGPYAVPSNPLAECVDVTVDVDAFARPAAGQPSLTCAWLPTESGLALVPRAVVASADEVVAWLDYLRSHFLGTHPLAAATRSGVPRFGRHPLDGAVAIADGTSGALDAVLVADGELRRVRLHPPTARRRSA
jgi:hypothetical protein